MIYMQKFNYTDKITPNEYVCCCCGKSNVKLYRDYSCFLENINLRCTKCTCIHEDLDYQTGDSIGWSVAAVPTEDGTTYWGYTSVPDDGVKWWRNLSR